MPGDGNVNSTLVFNGPPLKTLGDDLRDITKPRLLNLKAPKIVALAVNVPQMVASFKGVQGGLTRGKRDVINVGTEPVLILFGNGAQVPTLNNYHYPLAACSVADNGTGGAIDGSMYPYDIWAVCCTGAGKISVVEGELP